MNIPIRNHRPDTQFLHSVLSWLWYGFPGKPPRITRENEREEKVFKLFKETRIH